MRYILSVALALSGLAGIAERLSAQGKETEKKEEKSQIHEIGGKTLDQWIKEIPSKDRSRSENAIRTVLLFGPERAAAAVPLILKELARHSSTYPLDIGVRVNGIAAVGAILGSLKDPDPKDVRDTITVMTRLLHDRESVVKLNAAQLLAAVGPDARAAIPDLIALTRDKVSWEVRRMAIQALSSIVLDEENKAGVPLPVLNALFASLSDSAVQVRLTAVRTLMNLGPPANPDYRVRLVRLLENVARRDPEPAVQVWATMAVMSMTEVSSPHLSAIAKMLEHRDMEARVQAARALGTIGFKAKETLPALVAALDDREPEVVASCIWALGRMEQGAMRALPTLRQLAKDSNRPEPIRQAAAAACDHIEGKKLDGKKLKMEKK